MRATPVHGPLPIPQVGRSWEMLLFRYPGSSTSARPSPSSLAHILFYSLFLVAVPGTVGLLVPGNHQWYCDAEDPEVLGILAWSWNPWALSDCCNWFISTLSCLKSFPVILGLAGWIGGMFINEEVEDKQNIGCKVGVTLCAVWCRAGPCPKQTQGCSWTLLCLLRNQIAGHGLRGLLCY